MTSAPATSSLEGLYRTHHKNVRGAGFVLLKEERGALLRYAVGTGKKVVDIGCRDGALSETYMEGNQVLGVDIDSVALEVAQSRGLTTRHMDLNGAWDLPKGSFDAVVAAEVVEHLYYPGQVIAKAATLLTPQGILAGTVPNAFSFANRARYLRLRKKGTPLSDPTHINHFVVSELEDMLRANFKEVEIIGLGRLGLLARLFPQQFAFDLGFVARYPKTTT